MLKQAVPQRVNHFFKSNQKYITFFLKFILAGGLLYFLLIKLDHKEIYNLFLKVDSFYLSFAVLLLIANLGLRYTKWYLVSHYFFSGIGFKEVITSFFYGLVGNLSIPMNMGEYVGRTTVLKKYGSLKVILATAIDSYSSIILLVFFGSLAGAYYLYKVTEISIYNFIIITSILVILMILLILAWQKKRSVLSFIKQKFGERTIFTNAKKYFGMIYELDDKLLRSMFFLSALGIVVYLSQFVLLMFAFGADLSAINLYWIALLVMFSKAVIPPVTFGELGIREGVAVYFSKSFALSASIGFSAAFSLFIINIILPAVIGLFFFFRKSK